jgi:hypothetical protein
MQACPRLGVCCLCQPGVHCVTGQFKIWPGVHLVTCVACCETAQHIEKLVHAAQQSDHCIHKLSLPLSLSSQPIAFTKPPCVFYLQCCPSHNMKHSSGQLYCIACLQTSQTDTSDITVCPSSLQCTNGRQPHSTRRSLLETKSLKADWCMHVSACQNGGPYQHHQPSLEQRALSTTNHSPTSSPQH